MSRGGGGIGKRLLSAGGFILFLGVLNGLSYYFHWGFTFW